MFVEIRSFGGDRLFYQDVRLLSEESTLFAVTISSFLNLISFGEEKQTVF